MKDIIIIGMHRSGTSLTSSICQDLGVNIGKNLMGSNSSNPAGHFENIEFVMFHEKILKHAGGSWDYIPSRYDLLKSFNDNICEIKSIISKNKSKIWGWKDPRNTLFFDKYVELLENPMIIICFRNIYNIAKSLYDRDKISIKDGLKLANIYNRFISEGLNRIDSSIPILYVSFEEYFIDRYKQIDTIRDFIGSTNIPNYDLVIDEYSML